MDSRKLFQFRFVDRFDQKKQLTEFLHGGSQFNVLWMSGKQGIGKTRLIKEVIEKEKTASLICTFEEDNGIDKLEEFIKLLQNEADLNFSDFLKANYTSLLDISKQITIQILKLAGIDIGGFITAAYDGTKMFVNQKKQQHAAPKVIANYIKAILSKKSLVIIFDHFSSCKKELVDFFMQIVAQFVDEPKICFIISTTDEELQKRTDIRNELLLKIPVVPMELDAFDEEIYFFEILQEIFDIPLDARPIISQIFAACNGSPVRLQAALMELYRTNVIQLGLEKATIDFQQLKQDILQNEIGFKLEHYKIPVQVILRIIIGLKEQASIPLLLEAADYVIKRLFAGMTAFSKNLSEDIGDLYQCNVIDISVDGRSVVKISNPIIREILRDKFANDPVHRYFSKILVDFFVERREFILSTGITSERLIQMTVMHSIQGKVSDWVQTALDYGLCQYKQNHVSEALEVFSELQQEAESIPSKAVLMMSDCFYHAGKYDNAEGLLQIIECRNDYDQWEFNFYYSRIENLQLRKKHALELARVAANCAHNEKERIKALNMQQQILVDTTGGKATAKIIFDKLAKQFINADTETQRLILPTLKTAIDFYHGDEAFVYLEQAQQLCNDEDNQLEESFVLTNIGFEHFRQGTLEDAQQCFVKSATMLFDIRVHEISYPLNNLANCYMSQNKFEEAITVLLRASLWNTSGYAFVTIQTLLMVCYAQIGKKEKSLQVADNLISYIELFDITDNTMLRKIYLNLALVYTHLKESELAKQYAVKAYPLTINTSSWYRAYKIAKDHICEDRKPMDFCRKGEEWYWTSGCYEPWLITFSHD